MIHTGDCVQVMRTMPDASVDAVVTDPPYGLEFMGKEWDKNLNHGPWAIEAFRVLKPGGYLLAFGGTRTVHRLASAIEDAGFEIRDQLVWIYASGFPKSLNIGNGWGTALKPAHEPIVMARKPLVGTVAGNVAKYGTGALNIDGTRIGTTDSLQTLEGSFSFAGSGGANEDGKRIVAKEPGAGRWPSNILLSDPELFDEPNPGVVGSGATEEGVGLSRYFYVPKADRADREPVLRGQLPEIRTGGMQATADGSMLTGSGNERTTRRANSHPTVKPTDLMRHLVRLVTPLGGTVLDPFLGSGSTAIACEMEGFPWVGIEKEPEYVAIAEARLNGTQRGLAL